MIDRLRTAKRAMREGRSLPDARDLAELAACDMRSLAAKRRAA